jgi:hypothetical protein
MAATDISEVSLRQPVAVSGAVIHVLTAGCAFDMTRRCARLKAL